MPRHFEQPEHVTAPYAHIYVSPHLDDAVLSCGGAIALGTARGEGVLVVTLCAGAPADGVVLGPMARGLHASWGLPPGALMRARRQEDAAAAEVLGADTLWLGFQDAIYRLPEAYGEEAALFGALAPEDPLVAELRPVLEALLARCPGAVLHAPLGVGGHVDHRAAYSAAAAFASSGSVRFYEDFPYVSSTGALEARLEALGGAGGFAPEVIPIDAVLERKLDAIARYESQVRMLFGMRGLMHMAVREQTSSLAGAEWAHAERTWRSRVP